MIVVLFRLHRRQDRQGRRRRAAHGGVGENEETLRGWREHIRHRVAQRFGREQWYDYYTIEVAEIVRKNDFTRRVSRHSD